MSGNNDDPRSGGRRKGTVVRLAVTRLATLLLLLFFAVPLGTAAAQSQEKQKVPRVGYISPGSSDDPMRLRRFEAFRQGLRELGYVEGQSIVLEPRWAEGQYARYPALAADLVRLKEVVPKISRVAVLWNPDNPGGAPQLRQAEAGARALGVRLQVLEVRGPHELDSAFAAMTRERAGALVILNDAILGVNLSKQIAELAAKSHLPAVHGVPEYAQAGGLMVYGANLLDLERRAATFVDKILKGARPADLPIEQPSKFELIINLKTARALGLTIPHS